MTYDEFFSQQDLHAIKYHRCPRCDEVATLLVDIETDSFPNLDEQNRKQYFCRCCLEPFPVGAPIIPIHA